MIDYIQAWQCIGCGKIEAPQPCIGVCRDRKILMVGKDDHERVLDQMHRIGEQLQEARRLLSRLAWSIPREGQWERSYRALQEQAYVVLASLTQAEAAVENSASVD